MEHKYLIAIFFILAALFNEVRKYFAYKNLLGRELLFVYQENEFEPIQRKEGMILKKIKIGSGTHFIVNLKDPITFGEKCSNAIVIK